MTPEHVFNVERSGVESFGDGDDLRGETKRNTA